MPTDLPLPSEITALLTCQDRCIECGGAPHCEPREGCDAGPCCNPHIEEAMDEAEACEDYASLRILAVMQVEQRLARKAADKAAVASIYASLDRWQENARKDAQRIAAAPVAKTAVA